MSWFTSRRNFSLSTGDGGTGRNWDGLVIANGTTFHQCGAMKEGVTS